MYFYYGVCVYVCVCAEGIMKSGYIELLQPGFLDSKPIFVVCQLCNLTQIT